MRADIKPKTFSKIGHFITCQTTTSDKIDDAIAFHRPCAFEGDEGGRDRSSVFVFSSYREGVPRSTQEAMAMARPVITTDAPGCRETVIDGENGFLVPPRDVGALAEVMERFVLEPELIGRMGAASRRIAEERFDVRIINKRMMEAMGLG
ncbi:MAG: glycosyltransferase [Methanothrix sp.]|nr:glycosyltransferase [Methanothrix sp.]